PTPTPDTYTLSLHDALPILEHRLPDDAEEPAHRPQLGKAVVGHQPRHRELSRRRGVVAGGGVDPRRAEVGRHQSRPGARRDWWRDRKSTRLNSSHVKISYAV